MPFWGQLNFQDAASPTINALVIFHDQTMLVVFLVVSAVACALISLIINKLTRHDTLNLQSIEVIWTILPAIILFLLAFPSLRLLYLIDEINEPGVTIKSIGHQWYWRYEYSDFSGVIFDSYISPTEDLDYSNFRLLEVDNRVILPISAQIRILITAADVIHAWTIPSLGVKADAIPGRLNQLIFTIIRPGVFYGQCSEICGANHSFIPIVVEAVKLPSFLSWVKALTIETHRLSQESIETNEEIPTIIRTEKPAVTNTIEPAGISG